MQIRRRIAFCCQNKELVSMLKFSTHVHCQLRPPTQQFVIADSAILLELISEFVRAVATIILANPLYINIDVSYSEDFENLYNRIFFMIHFSFLLNDQFGIWFTLNRDPIDKTLWYVRKKRKGKERQNVVGYWEAIH